MTLATFVEIVKREMKYGDHTDTSYTDQSSKDIINSLNKRMRKFWRRWPWDWNVNEVSQSVSSGATSITLATADAQILLLNISGKRGYLRRVSFKYYLEWLKTDTDAEGTPSKYVPLGLTSAGLIKIKPWPTPSEDFTLSGWTRPGITDYVVGDISANTGIQYFPAFTHDILLDGVYADVCKLNGDKDRSKLFDIDFSQAIEDLIAEEQKNKPDEDPPNLLPSYMLRRNRQRRSGAGVGTGNY